MGPNENGWSRFYVIMCRMGVRVKLNDVLALNNRIGGGVLLVRPTEHPFSTSWWFYVVYVCALSSLYTSLHDVKSTTTSTVSGPSLQETVQQLS